MKRTVSIGSQSFSGLLEEKCFYIDKTEFIKELWEAKDGVTLITRPRRFGKTLNMSMLECFFSNRYAGRGDLFEGLKIWNYKEYRDIQGTYPVIFLSFAKAKANDFETLMAQIYSEIYDLHRDFRFLIESPLLNEDDKNAFRSVQRRMDKETAANAINRLCEWLHRYYGKKVIILLDEYDTPMQEAWLSGNWKKITDFFRSFFNATFKTNPYLERAVMTGITRVSKESMFSDLNNLNVVTTTSSLYGQYFGFTEEEVFDALDEMDLSDEKDDVKYMNTIALKSFSSFDVGGNNKQPERFYHGFVLGLLVSLREDYKIRSNRESGRGRYDVMLIPQRRELPAYIIEFKVHNPGKSQAFGNAFGFEDENREFVSGSGVRKPEKSKTLEDTLALALKQIEDMNYEQELISEGIPEENIRKYGFVFEGKTVLIG